MLPPSARIAALLLALTLAPTVTAAAPTAAGYTVIGWNNLGMHCMDADYAVFSILPPYNTIHAQVIDPSGSLVTSPAGITVTYEAVADPAGSINTTSTGKTNFWQYAAGLYGAPNLSVDVGLTGTRMPGAANVAQTMTFDPSFDWFVAEGIPITPYDDAHRPNPYPMMRIVVRSASGAVLATTQIVLPVSDEMDCRACHASSSGPDARPGGGWVNDPDPQRDYRVNILRLHDEYEGGTAAFQNALAAMGYNAAGLEATAVADQRPILCAGCHASNALPGTGIDGIPQLTAAVHGLHAQVLDPVTHVSMDEANNRSACYRCHPGSTTRCLRGAMGRAVATDGTMMMQCQSCHGTMSAVGGTRAGWLDEPACQNCHTGTARRNSGSIRYTTAFSSPGQYRHAADDTFATDPDVPAAGLSLYRFSRGHGGLACQGCHGSTHAEYPSTHDNDNVQSRQIQGHSGVLAECSACHDANPSTVRGGPHGMHPIGQGWVNEHGDVAEDGGSAACADCHGTNFRGTALSYALGPRTLSAFGTKRFWQGFQIGCYNCHKGPGGGDESANPNHPPRVPDGSATTVPGSPVVIPLQASDADGNTLTLRIVSQPAHGTAALSGRTATYRPEAGFEGADSFTFAAWDGQTNSNLGLISIEVGTAPPIVTGVRKATGPFRIVVTGSNFHTDIQASIDGQTWPNLRRVGDMKLVLRGGAALKALFPAAAWVPITLTNPGDGLSVTVEYNRTENAWRAPVLLRGEMSAARTP